MRASEANSIASQAREVARIKEEEEFEASSIGTIIFDHIRMCASSGEAYTQITLLTTKDDRRMTENVLIRYGYSVKWSGPTSQTDRSKSVLEIWWA